MPEEDEATGPSEFQEIPFEEVLRTIHEPLEANPELNALADELFTSERYDELIHQLAHSILVLGMVDPTACNILRPIMITLMALGYVLGATGEKAVPAENTGPAMSQEERENLEKLLGDVDLGGA